MYRRSTLFAVALATTLATLSGSATALSTTTASPESSPAAEVTYRPASKERLQQHLKTIQEHADASGGTREIGSRGHRLTAEYVKSAMEDLGLDVTIQPVQDGDSSTFNVIAESRMGSGDDTVVIGTQLASPAGSPGMNAAGTGTAALIEVARSLTVGSYLSRANLTFVFLSDRDEYTAPVAFWRSLEDTSVVSSYHHVEAMASADSPVVSYHAGTSAASFQRTYKDHGVAISNRQQSGPDVVFFARQKLPTSELTSMTYRDTCYGKPCDTIDNVDLDALALGTEAARANVFSAGGFLEWTPGGEPDYALKVPQHVSRVGMRSTTTIEVKAHQLAAVPDFIYLPSFVSEHGVKVDVERAGSDGPGDTTYNVMLSGDPFTLPGLHQVVLGKRERGDSRSKTVVVEVRNPLEPATCAGLNRTTMKLKDFDSVTSTVNVGWCGGKASATSRVALDVPHPFRGDINATLIAPSGTEYPLATRSFDSRSQLQETYVVDLSSEDAAGTWSLRVEDTAVLDEGYLNGWLIDLG